MPEFSVIHIGISTVAVLIGIVVGWLVRGKRCAQEKLAVNAGWQEQIEAQRVEHGRLVEQNKSLMQQVNQFQATGNDASNRARELSTALKEAFQNRDKLQQEIGEIRSNLDAAVSERRRLQSNLTAQSSSPVPKASELKEKDDKIFRLSRELDSWQDRLPPLIERFRERDEEAERLELELAEARERIFGLESVVNPDETRVETVAAETLHNDLEASNETINTYVEAASASSTNGADDARLNNDSQTENLRDNLKKIKGVGPAIEKTLNELGIFRFSQIAAMSEYDIDRVAKRLKGFRSRIYREDWIGQARELHDRQSGEQAP